jgi:dipeptidyl aminopeptidase/acylaminoacyl peptidase
LRICDLGTGEVSAVSELRDRHVMAVAQRPDGGPLAVVSWACPADDPGAFTARLHVVDVDSGKARDLGPLGVDADSPAWWNDGETWHVAYLAVPPPGTLGIAVFDVVLPADGGEAVHRDLTSAMNVCPVELVQIADGPPLALFADGLDTAVYQLDPATSRFVQLFHRQGQLDALTASRAGEVIALQASAGCEPKDVYAGSLHGELRRLSDTQPTLSRVPWGTQERISYRAADGLVLDGLLVLPVGRTREDGQFPLVTLVHGGPYWRFKDSLEISELPSSQWLAAAGYAVFLPNPRGSLGRGHALAASVAGAVGLAEWTDILRGIDVLIAEGVADPDRLGIGGWSHGGFMAAWAVGQTDRFKAAIMGAGICDWGLQAGVGELGALESELSGSSGWDGVGPLQHDRLSPISYAERIKTPVLILHGEQDTNVPLGQSIYFQRALRRFGVEHELVVYPREGHGMAERGHRIDVMRRGLAWFDRWLSPADAP